MPITERKTSMRRISLLILMFGFLVFCHGAKAGELTLLHSNDTRGVIDPCPT